MASSLSMVFVSNIRVEQQGLAEGLSVFPRLLRMEEVYTSHQSSGNLKISWLTRQRCRAKNGQTPIAPIESESSHPLPAVNWESSDPLMQDHTRFPAIGYQKLCSSRFWIWNDLTAASLRQAPDTAGRSFASQHSRPVPTPAPR
jgi:hypothetical protein